MTQLIIIVAYLALLLGLGYFTAKLFRGTSNDFFIASRSIGSFLLLASIFGTTMTAFALIGSTGEAYRVGAVTYGKIASISALIHSAVFFFIGTRLWAFGKQHGYLTQIQFFRARFDSDAIGYLLFPILVGLVIPYLLIGLLGAGSLVSTVTKGAFPEFFAGTQGAVPAPVTSAVISIVVVIYVCTCLCLPGLLTKVKKKKKKEKNATMRKMISEADTEVQSAHRLSLWDGVNRCFHI